MDFSTFITWLSLLIGLIGVILSVYFYRKTRKFKAIEISSVSDASVIEVKEPIPELKILYKEQEIDELWVLTFQIKNSGRVDLTDKDFVVPFHGLVGTTIVGAKIISRFPEHCDLEVENFGSDKVTFKTRLFKSGERAKVSLNLLGKPKLNFDANRIVDLQKIKIEDSKPFRKTYIYFLGLIIGIMVSLFANFITRYLITPDHLMEVSISRPVVAMLSEQPDTTQHLLAVSFINVGKTAIKPNDFLEPIRIKTEGTIIEMSNSMKGSSLNVNVEGQNSITIEPFILNPGQFAGIYLRVQGGTKVSVTGKVVGGLKVD